MGDNLPPGVTVSDLPGNGPKVAYSTREEACAVCEKPVDVRAGRWRERYFCDDHDEDDLRAMGEDRPERPSRKNRKL